MCIFDYSSCALSYRNDFRLLRLHADPTDSTDSPLNCSLYRVAIEQRPLYAAISYTWESAAPDEFLAVNGMHMRVKQNIVDLLRGLRLTNSDRILWIDAICINQEDEREKTFQIKMMSQIFFSASYVLSFLWSPDPDARAAYDHVIQYLRSATRDGIGNHPAYMSEEAADSMLVRRGSVEGATWSRSVSADFLIIDLYKHAWFGRRWVIAEVLLARSVLLFAGRDEEVPLRLLDEFVTQSRQRKEYIYNLLQETKYFDWAANRPERGSPITLLRAMRLAEGTNCSVVHDRIFALASLCAAAAKDFVIDYTMSISELACYTLAFATKHENLDATETLEFAVLLVCELGTEVLDTSGNREQIGDCRLLSRVRVCCDVMAVDGGLLDSSTAEETAHRGRKRLRPLPCTLPCDTGNHQSQYSNGVLPYNSASTVGSMPSSNQLNRVLGGSAPSHIKGDALPEDYQRGPENEKYEFLNENGFLESLSCVHSLIEAPAYRLSKLSNEPEDVIDPAKVGKDGTQPLCCMALTPQRILQTDVIWRLPGYPFGLVLREDAGGCVRVVCLAHLLACSETHEALSRCQEAATWRGPADSSRTITLELTIPALLRLADQLEYR